MGKYIGTYNRTLDAKKRLQLPAKMTEVMPSKFYMLRGFDGCIAVYEESEYEKLLSTLQPKLLEGPSSYKFIRMVMASVRELEVDSHGRVNLGEEVVEKYRLGTEIMVIGMIDHFEIWDPTSFAEYSNEESESYEEAAEKAAKHNG